MRSQNYIKSVLAESLNEEPRMLPRPASAIETLRDLIAALKVAVEGSESVAAGDVSFIGDGIDFFAEVDRFEIKMITQALRLARGSQVRACLLGLNATTLNSKIKSLNIDWKKDDEPSTNHRWRDVNSKGAAIQTET
jgi:DNA-binding NtrC family response regulator